MGMIDEILDIMQELDDAKIEQEELQDRRTIPEAICAAIISLLEKEEGKCA
jgi:hypothetical protein